MPAVRPPQDGPAPPRRSSPPFREEATAVGGGLASNRWLAGGLLESEADPRSAPDARARTAFASVRARRPANCRSAARQGHVPPVFRWEPRQRGGITGWTIHPRSLRGAP